MLNWVLLALLQYPLVELAQGDFNADHENDAIYYQRVGRVSIEDIKQELLTGRRDLGRYDLTLIFKQSGKYEKIGTIRQFSFPIRPFTFKSKARGLGIGYIVISDRNLEHHYGVYRVGTDWKIEVQGEFFAAFTKWLSAK